MRQYTIPIDAVAVSAVQDFFEVNCAATLPVRIVECFIGQSSDAGDAEDEQLRVRLIRTHSTSGSGGSSVTPVALNPGDAAFGGTAEINNTTPATGGSPVTIACACFNVRGGLAYRPIERSHAIVSPGGRFVVNLPAAPADALTVSGHLVIEEIG